MKASIPFFLLAFIVVSACKSYDLTKMKPAKVQTLYQGSLENAVYPTTQKVDDKLFAINQQNKALKWKTINDEEYVLMLSWKGDDKYYKRTLCERGWCL
jgi:hypothetical protein